MNYGIRLAHVLQRRPSSRKGVSQFYFCQQDIRVREKWKKTFLAKEENNDEIREEKILTTAKAV